MSPDRETTFADFLASESGPINLFSVGVHLVLAGVLAYLLGLLYIRFGRSASDRRTFAAHFVLITITTALIIVVVKSSLALSLGLVGALSIVRFRSAVREHEELAFLFLSIGLGLCLGAGQVALALLGFGIVAVFFIGRGVLARKVEHENLFLKVYGPAADHEPLQIIVDILSRCCTMVKLKRCDLIDGNIEADFQVEFSNLAELTKAQSDLQEKMSPLSISVIHGEGLA